ncbi:wax ester/triacylglycerol synthase domain-containing protein [Nocardia sp. NRRL WC-3656]|uniref:wax ester/triacylglycerol synthase domain-containing protein n=1 Tax=Nocardia sp. NRRL WC-3656 TaxID=1463824 RepID=UPI0018CC2329|nr:wax ester/triacylglycerol synthase domain-containing protein [Nocardia sp. NRRL WC-3656]
MSALRSTLDMPTTAMDRTLRGLDSAEIELNIGAVLHFDGPPPRLGDIQDYIATRLDALPALAVWMTPGARHWTVVDEVDLTSHVVEHVVPAQENLEQVVVELAKIPLPEDAPHWRMWLLRGYAPDRYALLYVVHHCVQDGAGMLRTLELLFAPGVPESESSAAYHGFAQSARASARTRLQCAATDLQSLRGLGTWDVPGCRATYQVGFAWGRVPTSTLTSIARAIGCTRNDVYMAALAHALTRWQSEIRGSADLPDIPFLVSANVRRPDEVALPGNRTAIPYLRLPGAPLSFDQRLTSTFHATAPLKSPTVRAAMRRNFDSTPAWLMRTTFSILATPRRTPASVSNVVLRHPLALHGDPVTAIDPITTTLGGIPLSVLLLVDGDSATACFRTDAGFPGLDQIHSMWEETLLSWQSNAATLNSA